MPLKISLFDPLSKEINSYKRIKPTQRECQCKKKELSLEEKTFVVLFLKFTAMRRADMTNLPL